MELNSGEVDPLSELPPADTAAHSAVVAGYNGVTLSVMTHHDPQNPFMTILVSDPGQRTCMSLELENGAEIERLGSALCQGGRWVRIAEENLRIP